MESGIVTTDHPRVGRRFRVWGLETPIEGECVSVTPWGNDQIRWVRLRFDDGSEKSYAPSYLREVA